MCIEILLVSLYPNSFYFQIKTLRALSI